MPFALRIYPIFQTALLAMIALNASAAPTGSLQLRTVDAKSKRPIPDVAVTLEARSGEIKNARSSPEGLVEFGALSSGLYRLIATANGRRTVAEPSVQVVAPRITTPRLEMQASAAEGAIEEVTVTARALQADRYSGVSATYLNRDELRNAVGAGGDVMRAAEALTDNGLRVHRAHWVSRQGFVRLVKKQGHWTCLLSNGLSVPVSRRNKPQVSRWFGHDAKVVNLRAGKP
jgi:hypothetical protein